MSDYDAFGRKKGESGHDDLGWGTTADPGAVSNDEPVLKTSTADQGFSSSPEFRTVPTNTTSTSRTTNVPIGGVIRLAILAAVAFAIWSAIDAGRDAVDAARGTIEVLRNNGNGKSDIDRGDDTVPEQIKARKLFTPDGLRASIKILEREVPGRVTNFSVHREAIYAQVVGKGRRNIVTLNADANVPDITSAPASAIFDSLSYEEINPTAPKRLIAEANQRLNKSDANVNYLIPSKTSGSVGWCVYYTPGSSAACGDSRGRYQRRIG